MTKEETFNDFAEFKRIDTQDRSHYKTTNDRVFLYLAHILQETNVHLRKISQELEKQNKVKKK